MLLVLEFVTVMTAYVGQQPWMFYTFIMAACSELFCDLLLPLLDH
jgi:hypothetical protein